ncbi:MAG: AAA family ATPase [Gammaproteobacteria bacterium]
MAHQYLERKITNQILGVLNQGKSILLLGPRQTGKTTLVKTIAHDRYLNLMYPDLRQRYESTPELFGYSR